VRLDHIARIGHDLRLSLMLVVDLEFLDSEYRREQGAID
jgi:hypothetical protein